MKESEIIKRDIGLTFDFIRYLIDNPEVIDEIPDGAEVIFLSDEIPLEREISDLSVEKSKKAFFNCHYIFEPIGLKQQK